MDHTFPPARGLVQEVAALRAAADLREHAASAVERVEAHDPVLQAFVPEPHRCERVLAEAGRLSRRWSPRPDRPALYGATVGVKDVLRVDGLETTAGSALPPQVLGGPEASVVRRLRDAGALVLGKTVTAEFAHAAPGPTRNPRALGHTPGGSSSGSAAAVAAGLVTLGVGTQTVGSTIRPAAYCGITGYRPTHGRIPVDGVIANAPSFDVVGLLARRVEDVALAASVIVDGWTPAAVPDRPLVVGVPEGPYLDLVSAEGRAGFEAALERLREVGVVVRRVPAVGDLEALAQRQVDVGRYEIARTHVAWFAAHAEHYRPETVAAIRQGQTVTRQEYDEALAGCAVHRAGLVARMDAEGLDLWVAPSAVGPAPEGLSDTGSSVMSLPWSQAGLPAVGLPAGCAPDGLPLGLQCVARPGADEHLLAWAAAVLEPVLLGVVAARGLSRPVPGGC